MTEIFPTDFAKMILQEAELYPSEDLYKIKDLEERARLQRQIALLKEFQQMSMYGKFENCLKIYHKSKLEETQISALQLVYDLTADWSKGYISERLLARLSWDKAAAQLASVLFDNMGGSSGGDNDKEEGGLIVHIHQAGKKPKLVKEKTADAK